MFKCSTTLRFFDRCLKFKWFAHFSFFLIPFGQLNIETFSRNLSCMKDKAIGNALKLTCIRLEQIRASIVFWLFSLQHFSPVKNVRDYLKRQGFVNRIQSTSRLGLNGPIISALNIMPASYIKTFYNSSRRHCVLILDRRKNLITLQNSYSCFEFKTGL